MARRYKYILITTKLFFCLFHERNEEEEISHAMTLIMEVELRLLFMRYRKRSSISLLPDLYLEASSQSQLPKTNFLSRSCHLQKRVGVSSSCSFFYLKKKCFYLNKVGITLGSPNPIASSPWTTPLPFQIFWAPQGNRWRFPSILFFSQSHLLIRLWHVCQSLLFVFYV